MQLNITSKGFKAHRLITESEEFKEQAWKRFERHQTRRERQRLISKGDIVPAYAMKPQMMVKDINGDWSPFIGVN